MEKITHLMPVKNGSLYLIETLRSIAENAMHDDEILVINDGSSDGTLGILNETSKKLSNFRVISTKGVGIVKSLNLGVSESSNVWVARYDVDDFYSKDRVLKQRALISNKVAAIFCDYELILDNGISTGLVPSAVDNLATIISLLFSQQTPHPGVILNKSCMLAAGGYLESDFPAEDLSLWLRMCRYGELISAPEVLFRYRISNSSTSGSRQIEAKHKKNMILQKYGLPVDQIQLNFDELNETFVKYSKLNLADERKLLFLRNVGKLNKMYPNLGRINYFAYPNFIVFHPRIVIKLTIQKLRRWVFRKYSV
jgi:glycosyltransferase involved in cell wall biosynthesis